MGETVRAGDVAITTHEVRPLAPSPLPSFLPSLTSGLRSDATDGDFVSGWVDGVERETARGRDDGSKNKNKTKRIFRPLDPTKCVGAAAWRSWRPRARARIACLAMPQSLSPSLISYHPAKSEGGVVGTRSCSFPPAGLFAGTAVPLLSASLDTGGRRRPRQPVLLLPLARSSASELMGCVGRLG